VKTQPDCIANARWQLTAAGSCRRASRQADTRSEPFSASGAMFRMCGLFGRALVVGDRLQFVLIQTA
jgi:hypothetical protein